MESSRAVAPILIGVVACASGARGQIEFLSVETARGIVAYEGASGLSTGFAAADYDDDGDVDLFIPTRDGVPNQLYRNLGTGHFEEIAGVVGLAGMENARSALWLDANADGRLDLVVGHDVYELDLVTITSTLALYLQNPDGTFTDTTPGSGLAGDLEPGPNMHIGGIAAGDLDNDGDLDLCVALWEGTARLYRANGDGTFEDVSVPSGVGTSVGTTWQPVMHDFNHDRLLDIFMAHDFAPNQLWVNQGALAFTDSAPASGVDTAFNEMGIALGDPDNDGDTDVYVTNIYTFDTGLNQQKHNVLFRNDTTGTVPTFAEIATEAGVDNGGIGWGTTFLDADNDGWEDLAESNSIEFPSSVPMKLWRNPGDGTLLFEDVSADAGVDFHDRGTSLLAFDSDRDGDEDLFQLVLSGPLRVLENQQRENGGQNGWLVIRPRMPGPNTRAIGAVVRAEAGGLSMMRTITAGISFAGQEPAEAFFGLGGMPGADVSIQWPNAMTTELSAVQPNQVLTVMSPCACGQSQYDVDGNGDIDLNDLVAIHASTTDVNFDGAADPLDIACLKAHLRLDEIADVMEGR